MFGSYSARTILLCSIIIVFWTHASFAQESDACSKMTSELETKLFQLKNRVAELEIAQKKRDSKTTSNILDHIEQLASEIRILDLNVSDCSRVPVKEETTLEPVKSHSGDFANLNCDDLARKHVQTSRKINSLRRQIESVGAEPGSDLHREYKENEKTLSLLKNELATRCMKKSKPSPKQRH